MALKENALALRINSDHINKIDITVETQIGKSARYCLLSIPFYLVGQIHRLLDETMIEKIE